MEGIIFFAESNGCSASQNKILYSYEEFDGSVEVNEHHPQKKRSIYHCLNTCRPLGTEIEEADLHA